MLRIHPAHADLGVKPWERDAADCVVLCIACRPRANSSTAADSEWIHVGYEDLGAVAARCECCSARLRHLFLVHHPEWGTMEVGPDCCDRLTATGAAKNEVKLRQKTKRLSATMSWNRYPNGEAWIYYKDKPIALTQVGYSYRLIIDGQRGSRVYPAPADAENAVYRLIASGDFKRRFLKRTNRATTPAAHKSRDYRHYRSPNWLRPLRQDHSEISAEHMLATADATCPHCQINTRVGLVIAMAPAFVDGANSRYVSEGPIVISQLTKLGEGVQDPTVILPSYRRHGGNNAYCNYCSSCDEPISDSDLTATGRQLHDYPRSVPTSLSLLPLGRGTVECANVTFAQMPGRLVGSC